MIAISTMIAVFELPINSTTIATIITVISNIATTSITFITIVLAAKPSLIIKVATTVFRVIIAAKIITAIAL